MKKNLNVLLAIINAYEESDGFSNFSGAELNRTFGYATDTLAESLRNLVELKKIENHTKNGFYHRYKVLDHVGCPRFILNKELNNFQKSFLLRCLEHNITEDLSKKEIARRVNKNENTTNLNKMVSNIETIVGDNYLQYLKNNSDLVSGLTPSNSVKTEHGYRTDSPKKYLIITDDTSQEEIIASFLYRKSKQGWRLRNKIMEYTISEDYIRELLLKQEYKDYYTGLIPENYEEYSIDRIDSNLGYVEGNIVITTNKVNAAKNDMTTEEFKKLISDLYNNISNF